MKKLGDLVVAPETCSVDAYTGSRSPKRGWTLREALFDWLLLRNMQKVAETEGHVEIILADLEKQLSEPE
jgi:hypothetical protein